MRGLLIAVAPTLVGVFLMLAAKPVPDDSIEIMARNDSNVVEQQSSGGGICYTDGDWSDCVTNTGPCVWDPDDSLRASSADGQLAVCQFADWAGQSYQVILLGHKRHDLSVQVTLDPPLRLTGTFEETKGFLFDAAIPVQKPYETVRGCFRIDIAREHEGMQTIPHQGGLGEELGIAVPLTLTFDFPEGTALTVLKRGIEDCP